MLEILDKIVGEYLEFLWKAFQYDMDVFSQGWLYAWLLIPAVIYFVFFIFKWIVMTAPLWIPIRAAISGFYSVLPFKYKKTVQKNIDKCVEEKK